MMFVRYGTTWRVDDFGALWFEIDGPECWGEQREDGRRWLRWMGIDL